MADSEQFDKLCELTCPQCGFRSGTVAVWVDPQKADSPSWDVESTPRTDALLAKLRAKTDRSEVWTADDMQAMWEHAREMERLAKRWQKIADQRAIEVADLGRELAVYEGCKDGEAAPAHFSEIGQRNWRIGYWMRRAEAVASSTRRDVLREAAEICSSRGYIHRGVNDALSKEAFDCMADIMALAESPRPEAVMTWACGWAGTRCLRMGCTKQHPCSDYTPSPRGEPTPACTSPTGVCLSPRACDYHGKCKNSTL